MMDPTELEDIGENDELPNIPTASAGVGAYANAAVLNALHSSHESSSAQHSPPPPSSPQLTRNRPRRGSSASHVELDHFDPSGVRDLKRTLSRISGQFEAGEPVEEERTALRKGDYKENVVGNGAGVESEVTLAAPAEGPFDFEKVLRTVVKKREAHEIKARQLGVMFKDLHVTGLGASSSQQATVGSTLNLLNLINSLRTARNPPLTDILSGFEGVVRPGEMLLVLGRPGSGCTSLLKTLANQRDEFHAVEGEVHYDSFSPEEIANHYRGDVQYCPEDDVHFPTLTVQQTLLFAAKTRTPQARARIDQMSREHYTQTLVDILMTIFGLRHVKDTLVGDAKVRGVSGGQKKRVSIAEALACRSLLNAWDNSTRGLDSSTALEFVRALRIATDIAHVSTIVSIYQAGESLYQLFDKVCVIYEGKMAYFGPADRARQFFIDMGYVPADRQTTADFLVAVTDPNGRTERRGLDRPIPRASQEFADHFKSSELGQLNREDMDSYVSEFVGQSQKAEDYKRSVRAERAKHASKKSPFTISIGMQTRAVMLRRVQILKGNFGAQAVQTASFIVQAIIIGTVFYQVADSTSAYFSRGGVLFFALLFSALTTMSEIPAMFYQRPIVLRHYRAAMYHPFIEALATTLVDVPITFITIAIFSIVLYFLVGLQTSAAQFFTFFLFVFCMALVMKSFFRLLASAFKDPSPAQTLAGLAVLVLTLYTGYNIPKPSMIGALRWITYINPLRYGYEAVLTNEFRTLDGTCASLVPSGPGYEDVSIANQVCTTVGSVAGQDRVDGNQYVGLSFGYYYSNTWRNLGILIAFGIGFLILLLIFSEYNTGSSTNTSVMKFKRGSQAAHARNSKDARDEEKAIKGAEDDATETSTHNTLDPETEKVIAAQPPMTDVFSWQHLDYIVPAGGEQRKLLDDVSGYVAPGKLTALMGESGAGKTTLLNVLAERTTNGVVTGDRFVNGQALPADFQAQTGYCQQMDTHLETQTVREALLFSAKLRQPADVPLSEKESYVDVCLKMCGLEDYADAVVGSLGVEHRKRTTIGVELAAKPKLLLFLDEPTSGLDSQSAWAIVNFLRSLADSGQAILCTIHQPSAELFCVFDRLLLLRKGGQTVYFGDLGRNSASLIGYFQRNGSRECSPQENPAEFMLDVIGAGATATSVIDWHDAWVRSEEARRLQAEIENIHSEGRKRPPVVTSQRTDFATTWPYQVTELFRRAVQKRWRDPVYIMSKLALNIVAGLFIGFTFFKAKDTIQGTQNKLFAIFMATIISVSLAQQVQTVFIHMRGIYEVRERPSRMYSWTALLTAELLVEIPWNILGSTLFFLCWYWTVGFPSSRGGYTYLMLGIMFPLYYTSFGQAVAAMAPNVEIAALLFSFLYSFVLTFNGVLQPRRQLGWWTWMNRVTPFTYLIEGLLGQAIGRTQVTCSSVEYVTLTPPSGQTCGDYLNPFISTTGGYITNPDASDSCQYCSARTTDQFLGANFSIEYSHHWRDFGILWIYLAFNVAALFALTFLCRIHSWSWVGSLTSRLRRK